MRSRSWSIYCSNFQRRRMHNCLEMFLFSIKHIQWSWNVLYFWIKHRKWSRNVLLFFRQTQPWCLYGHMTLLYTAMVSKRSSFSIKSTATVSTWYHLFQSKAQQRSLHDIIFFNQKHSNGLYMLIIFYQTQQASLNGRSRETAREPLHAPSSTRLV